MNILTVSSLCPQSILPIAVQPFQGEGLPVQTQPSNAVAARRCRSHRAWHPHPTRPVEPDGCVVAVHWKNSTSFPLKVGTLQSQSGLWLHPHQIPIILYILYYDANVLRIREQQKTNGATIKLLLPSGEIKSSRRQTRLARHLRTRNPPSKKDKQ